MSTFLHLTAQLMLPYMIILTFCLIDPGKFLSHLSPIFRWLSQQPVILIISSRLFTLLLVHTAQCVNTVRGADTKTLL